MRICSPFRSEKDRQPTGCNDRESRKYGAVYRAPCHYEVMLGGELADLLLYVDIPNLNSALKGKANYALP